MTSTKIQSGTEVTETIRLTALAVYDRWFSEKLRTDWDQFWDRLNATILPDGTYLRVEGEDARLSIRRFIRKERSISGRD